MIPNPNDCDCGSDDIEVVEEWWYSCWWRVACLECGKEGSCSETIAGAVASWNREV